MRSFKKKGVPCGTPRRLVASLGRSAQRIERWPQISRGASRLLVAAAERIEAGAELRYAGEEAGDRLPERGEEAPVSWVLHALLSGDNREGDEDEEEEDDGGARPHPVKFGVLGHEDLQGRSGLGHHGRGERAFKR